MKQKNFYKLIVVLYFVITIFLEIFNGSFLTIETMPQSENFNFWYEWADDPSNETFLAIYGIYQSIAVLSPFVFMFFYLVPVFFGKKNANTKIVKAPIFLALLNSVFGLVLAIGNFIVCMAIYIDTGKLLSDVIVFVIVLNLLAGCLIFSLTYLVLETLNRTFVLKRIFTEGNISGISGLHKHSLVITFLSFFLGFVFCPIAYALFYNYKFSVDYGFVVDGEFYFKSLFFVLAGILVTILLTNIFRETLIKSNLFPKQNLA